MAQTYFGGSFAPELTDQKLEQYADLVRTVEPSTQIGDYLRQLLKAVQVWWALPVSTGGEPTPHQSGRGILQPLTEEIKQTLWDHIPWEAELNAIQAELDTLPAGDLRNAAFHLLWHVKELNLDREPLTREQVGL